MANIIVPSRKIATKQPDNGASIDRSNPFTRKLIIASIPVGGKLVNIVNGTHAVETQSVSGGTNPAIFKKDAIAGNGFGYDGLWHKFSNQNFNPNNPFTIICTAYANSGILRSYNGLFNVGVSGDFYLLQAQLTRTVLYSSTLGYIYTDIPIWDGLNTIAVVSHGTTTSIYWNGALLAANTASNGWSRESTNVAFAIGDDPGFSGNDGWPGSIYTTQVYAEELPATAIESLSKNPWQVFATPNTLTFSGTSTGLTATVAITTANPTIAVSATGAATVTVAVTTARPTIASDVTVANSNFATVAITTANPVIAVSATGAATTTVAITTSRPDIAGDATVAVLVDVAVGVTTQQPVISGLATGLADAAAAITTSNPGIYVNIQGVVLKARPDSKILIEHGTPKCLVEFELKKVLIEKDASKVLIL